MKVTSTGILHGVISDEYGKRGTQFNAHGMPTYSLPLSIQDAPAGTVSYAIVLEDKDAYPVSGGFVWIHWTVANLTRTELEENESISATDFVQGANSWMSVQGGQQSRKVITEVCALPMLPIYTNCMCLHWIQNYNWKTDFI